jgi:rhodanese-related sulfurtransferase
MTSASIAPWLEPDNDPNRRPGLNARALDALLSSLVPNGTLLSPAVLERLTSAVAGERALWEALVIEDDENRWHVKLHQSVFFDVWLLGWQWNQETDWHDHGGSSGSFGVAGGTLVEEYRRPGSRRLGRRELTDGYHVGFGPTHVHNLRHVGDGQALSIHAYSPPLVAMTYYALGPFGLTAVETLAVDSPEGARTRSAPRGLPPSGSPTDHRSILDLLDDARLGLDRLRPEAAFAEIESGAMLIDIRPPEQRLVEGEVPGAFIIGRNVLEWRLDPRSDASIPDLARYDRRVIVMCSEGYASSLAAASLRQIGLSLATDLEGGFQAWKAAGLPTRESV